MDPEKIFTIKVRSQVVRSILKNTNVPPEKILDHAIPLSKWILTGNCSLLSSTDDKV